MQYQCGNTYISGRRTKRELPKAQTKRELMQMKHSAKEIRAKGNIESKRDIKNKIKKDGDFQWQCPEKKNVDKKKLAKQQKKKNAEYYLCSCGPPASTVKTFGYSNANKGRPSCLEMETKILIRYQENIYQGRCTR